MLVASFVVTGGPCAGKTTAMSNLRQWLEGLGIRVLIVPETATIIISGGVADIGALAANNRPAYYALQREIVRKGMDNREFYRRLAEDVFADERVVLLFDRAECDSAAYTASEEFFGILADLGTTLSEVRDGYTCVIHLVTAADGAEKYYTTANNAARMETPEQARALDALTLAGWVGHPRLRIIDNSTDFAGKLHRMRQVVAQVLGVTMNREDVTATGADAPASDTPPMGRELEEKYRLLGEPDLADPLMVGAKVIDITQTYLVSEATEERVRSWTPRGGGTTYFHTVKGAGAPGNLGDRPEGEAVITRVEYDELLRRRDPARRTIVKVRRVFVYGGLVVELDEILEPVTRAGWQAEVEIVDPDQSISLPDCLGPFENVTQDPRYYNRVIAEG